MPESLEGAWASQHTTVTIARLKLELMDLLDMLPPITDPANLDWWRKFAAVAPNFCPWPVRS